MIIEIWVEDDVGVAATVVAASGPFTPGELTGGDFEPEDLTRIRDLMVL